MLSSLHFVALHRQDKLTKRSPLLIPSHILQFIRCRRIFSPSSNDSDAGRWSGSHFSLRQQSHVTQTIISFSLLLSSQHFLEATCLEILASGGLLAFRKLSHPQQLLIQLHLIDFSYPVLVPAFTPCITLSEIPRFFLSFCVPLTFHTQDANVIVQERWIRFDRRRVQVQNLSWSFFRLCYLSNVKRKASLIKPHNSFNVLILSYTSYRLFIKPMNLES